MNSDFQDMLSALSAENAEFIVVGAYAVAAHGHPRATGDMDIWVRPIRENAERVMRAIVRFGAPLHDLTVTDLHTLDTVYQIGVEPRRIDILTSIDGLGFDEAWEGKKKITLGQGEVFVLGREHLIRNKKAAGREKDLGDVAWLEKKGNQRE